MTFLRPMFGLLPVDLQRSIRQTVQRRRAARPQTVDVLTSKAFPNLRPLKIVPALAGPCVTMVTDSVAPGQLMGGVGTAVLLAASIAHARNWRLRIVVREFRCDDVAVRTLLALQKVVFDGPIEIIFSDGSSSDPGVPLNTDDLVITTSWWGTWSTRRTVPARQIVYLLQEDERMFYAGGDQHLLCDETLNDLEIRYVVNSTLLMTHFQATATLGPANHGIAFEPAFPDTIYYPEARGARRNLVFYARPDHPRNLFLRGIEALDFAFAAGLFPATQWDVHFFGVNVPQVTFPGRPIQVHNTLPWHDYAALMRRADLGFSLMYTPHPSYPPLDLAASGAVVVTNRFGPKGETAQYCDNIIYSPLAVEALVEGLIKGIARAEDTPSRHAAYERADLNRDWATSFAPVLTALADDAAIAVSHPA